jgi:hypothetical protein
MDPLTIRAVAFQRDGRWIAQCLEYDLCTSAKDQKELARKLASQLHLQIKLDRSNGKEPFQDFRRAPQTFWSMYLASTPSEELQIGESWLASLFRAWRKPQVQARLALATA